MEEKYLPKTPEGRLFRLIEECNEVIHEACKLGRFGPNGDPEWMATATVPIPRIRLLNELADLRHAIAAVEADLAD